MESVPNVCFLMRVYETEPLVEGVRLTMIPNSTKEEKVKKAEKEAALRVR